MASGGINIKFGQKPYRLQASTGHFQHGIVPMTATTSQPPTITTSATLPAGTVGSAYSQQLAASGGTPPYTWSKSSSVPGTGGFPACSSSGLITGTPSTAETEALVIQVSDRALHSASKTFSLAVTTAASWQLPASHTISAKQSMIRVYPRPDAETSVNARHRWAYYDGSNPVQYTVPVGVSFGRYPYFFQLTSAPSGMAIGQTYGSANYGVITWTPSGSVTNATVTVLVTDQDSNTLTITYTVSTSSSTAHFVFVSPSGNDSAGGTFAAPWQTLSKAFGSTYAASAPNVGACCYVRAGTYTPPFYAAGTIGSSTNAFQQSVTRKCAALIGYPGESVILTMSGGRMRADAESADYFEQNIAHNGGVSTDANFDLWALTGVGTQRMVWDNVSWTNAVVGTAGNDNATGWMSDNGGGSTRKYLYLRNCSETNRPGGRSGNNYAGFSLYACQYSLVDGFTVSTAGAVDGACYFKGDEQDCTMRNCFVKVGTGSDHGCSLGFPQNLPPSRNEICYNIVLGVDRLETGTDVGSWGINWVYRNNVTGSLESHTPTTGGPYIYENNMLQTTRSPSITTGSQMQPSGNQVAASGALDSTSGQLIGTYRTNYLGTVGAEIA